MATTELVLKIAYNRAVYLYNLEDFEIEYPSVEIKENIKLINTNQIILVDSWETHS